MVITSCLVRSSAKQSYTTVSMKSPTANSMVMFALDHELSISMAELVLSAIILILGEIDGILF